MRSRGMVVLAILMVAACGGAPTRTATSTPQPEPVQPESKPPTEPAPDHELPAGPAVCGGQPLRVAFFNAGQALSALVTLPDGKHILVDAGESATRPGCGAPCKEWHGRVMTGLARELGAAPIDLLWITHPHSDHIGGAVDVLDHFAVHAYVDNGRDLDKATIRKTHDALDAHHVSVAVIEPGHTTIPLETSNDVKLIAIVPPHWYEDSGAQDWCAKNANICSIALRIDYCASSVLFTGDAELLEEADLAIDAPVTLLQVGHHGSKTSSSPALLDRAKPKYAVISAGKPGEGTNATYCHPRKETVDALTAVLGGAGGRTIHAFPSVTKCDASGAEARWIDQPASDHLWVTARDGDVVLTTTGDGVFTRE